MPAIRSTAALKIYVGNLMSEPGETDGLTLADHVEAAFGHGGPGIIEGVVAHGRPFLPAVLQRYQAAGARPVVCDRDRLRALGLWVTEADLTGPTEKARHHPEKLGRVLVRLMRHRGPAPPSRGARGGDAGEIAQPVGLATP